MKNPASPAWRHWMNEARKTRAHSFYLVIDDFVYKLVLYHRHLELEARIEYQLPPQTCFFVPTFNFCMPTFNTRTFNILDDWRFESWSSDYLKWQLHQLCYSRSGMFINMVQAICTSVYPFQSIGFKPYFKWAIPGLFFLIFRLFCTVILVQ